MTDRRTTDENIEHIMKTLDAFVSEVQTPAKILAWVIAAMVAGIAGAFGVKIFTVVVKWSVAP